MATYTGDTERLIQGVIRRIMDGRLEAGSRLPTESEIAEKYGIAKTNVHLGVKELQRLGLVTVVPRHATYISDTSENITLEGVLAVFRYCDGLPNRPMVEAMLELREMMACGVIRWMVRRPDRAHLEKLKTLCGDMEQAAGDPEQFRRAVSAFLTAYYQEAGNDVFPLLVRSFRDIVSQSMRYIAKYADPKEMASVYRSMLLRVEAGDLSAAQSVWTAWNDNLSYQLLDRLYE